MSLFADMKKQYENTDFNEEAERVRAGIENKVGSDFNDPRFYYPERDKQGNATVVVRFLPDKDHTKVAFVKTFSHGFKSKTGKWYGKPCPTTIGEDCPVCNYNSEVLSPYGSKIDNAPSAVQKEVRDRKRKMQYISNILVVSDPANPENNGKVFMMRYGAKIMGKITKMMEEPKVPGGLRFNAFDVFNGHDFVWDITKVEGQTNYDNSTWQPTPRAIAETEDEFEAIMNQRYDIYEFVAPERFGKFSDLETEFNRVMGLTFKGPSQDAPSAGKSEDAPEEDDDDGDSVQSAKSYFDSL